MSMECEVLYVLPIIQSVYLCISLHIMYDIEYLLTENLEGREITWKT
jgi:hypothetical protein